MYCAWLLDLRHATLPASYSKLTLSVCTSIRYAIREMCFSLLLFKMECLYFIKDTRLTKENIVYELLVVCRPSYKTIFLPWKVLWFSDHNIVSHLFLWPPNICYITHFVCLFISFLYFATNGCCLPYLNVNKNFNIKIWLGVMYSFEVAAMLL